MSALAIVQNRDFPDLAPSFPQELKNLNRWIVRTADKVPHSAFEGDENLGPIDPHDQQYQADYDTAMGALNQTTLFSGAGFVFNYADGLTGTDFDHCVNLETLEIRADVSEIIAKMNSYAEFSPSRTGVHVITKGWQFPWDGTKGGQQGSKVGNAEMYSGKRYFTVTGHHVPGTPTTVNQADLGWLYERVVTNREFFVANKKTAPGSQSAEGCIVTAKNPSLITTPYNVLMNGTILRSKDTTHSTDFAIEDDAQIREYESQNSADYALLALIRERMPTDDAEAIKQEFLLSPLGQRRKATTGTYVDRSIAKLLKSPRKLRIELHDEDADGDTAGVAIDRPKLLTEVGNGRRLIETYGRNIRYCPEDDCWLYFGGKVWLKDKRTVHVHDLMKRVLIQMQQEASAFSSSVDPALMDKLNRDLSPKKVNVPLTAEELEEAKKNGSRAKSKKLESTLSAEEWQFVENYKTAEAFKDWAKQSESNQKISGSVNQAKSEPGVSIAKSALDTNTLVCNVENGAFRFDPERGSTSFGKHQRDDFGTKMMPVTYDPIADCPQFKAFISWMFPEKGVQDYVQTYLGLCLSGLIVRKILILYGEGANGKSTLMKVLYHMFGEALDRSGSLVGQAYSQPVAFSTFTVSREETAGAARADLMPLKGARLITASESNKASGKYQAKLDMARLKEMTGGDPTVTRGLYQAEQTRFVNQGKIILQTNNIPAINDDSDGAWDRLELLSCKSRIEEKDQDKQLAEKLISESSGILNWLLEGLMMYFRQGLVETESMEADTEAYRGSENHMARFVDEECDVVDQETVRTPTSTVYRRYTCWCSENGETAESQKALTQYLQRKHKIESKHMRDGYFLCKIQIKAAIQQAGQPKT